jgi:hypothetical protein
MVPQPPRYHRISELEDTFSRRTICSPVFLLIFRVAFHTSSHPSTSFDAFSLEASREGDRHHRHGHSAS